MELLVYAAKAAIVFALGMVPGYLLMARFCRQEGWELALNSAAFSVLFAGASEFAAYLLNADAGLFNFSATVLLCAGLVASMRLERKPFPALPRLAWAFALAFAGAIAVQALIPVYAGAYWANDWMMHYDIARFYLDHGPLTSTWTAQADTPTSRTPLFNLAGAFFMSMLGNEFWTFQEASSFLNLAFLLPVALLARRLGYGKYSAAAFALALAILNASLLSNAIYTWSKLIISLFLLGAIWYYLGLREGYRKSGKLDRKQAAFFGLYAGAAFMSHQTALYYLIPLALDFAILSIRLFTKNRKAFLSADWKAILLLFAAGLAVFLPWHLWAFNNYGIEKTLSSSPALKNGFTSQSFLDDRIANAVATLYPVFTLHWYGKWFANSSPLDLLNCREYSCYSGFYSVTLRFWLDVLPGALTLTGDIALLAVILGAFRSGTWKNMLSPSRPEFALALMLPISFAFGCLTTMYVDEKGWMPLFLPILLILQIFIARAMCGWGRLARTAVLAGAILEFAVIKGMHVYLLYTDQITKAEGWNTPLKIDNHLVFAFDYLGGWTTLCALAAISIYLAFAICALKLAWSDDPETQARRLLGEESAPV
jgi:hypothetical protein